MCPIETLSDHDEIGGFAIARTTISVDSEDWLERIGKYIIIDEKLNFIGFKLQDGPIKEFGENGCQIDTMLKACEEILKGLNAKFESPHNGQAILAIQKALWHLNQRTMERKMRGVEGTSSL